jgi:hypothetical protein
MEGYVTPNDARMRREMAAEIAEAIGAMCPEPGAVHAGGHCDFAEAAATARRHAEVRR